MLKPKTGYCPVHKQNITVEIEYVEMRVTGTNITQKKQGNWKCLHADHTNIECSRCPIVYK